MDWIIVFVIVTIAVTPVIGLRGSNRQKKIVKMRRRARDLGMQVNLHRRPDAEDDDRDLDFVCYKLLWKTDLVADSYVLHCCSARGLDSSVSGWRWFNGKPDPELAAVFESVISDVPDSTVGILCDQIGIGIIWKENTTIGVVDSIHMMLLQMQSEFEKKVI